MSIPNYDALFTGDLHDMKEELRMISHQADPEIKLYIQEIVDMMYRYGVSPYEYSDIVNGDIE